MKKKHIVSTIIMLSTTLFCGCGNSVSTEQSSNTQSSDAAIQQEMTLSDTDIISTLSTDKPKLDDGVYRTYSLGTILPENTVLDLNVSFLLENMEEPAQTVIFYNGHPYKTVEFSNEDEEIILEESGNYWIILIDEDNNYVDITDKIDYLVPNKGNGIFLLE